MSTDKTINFTERSGAPDTPATGDWRLYFKSTGAHIVDDVGTETPLGAGGDTLPVPDTTAVVKGSADESKMLRFEVDGFTAEQTRVATPPDEDFTMVGVATAQTLTNKTISASANTIGMGSGVIKTIATGVAAAGTDRNLIIAAESGTADDLIEVTGLSVGESVLLRADTGDTITVKHNDAGATVKIHLHSNADLTALDEQNPLRLTLVATNVLVEDVQSSAGGGATVVAANKVHKFATNQTSTSGTMVDVDATNAAITATMTGGGKCHVIFSFRASKNTAGSAFWRMTDGTNSSDEVETVFAAVPEGLTLHWVFDTSAGSATYKLQYRTSDASAVVLQAGIAVSMSLMEVA